MNVNTLNITIEQLVPSNHLARKLDASIDFMIFLLFILLLSHFCNPPV